MPAQIQRNKREEADTVNAGTMPLEWKAHKRAQKDVDAKWAKKHDKNHFAYKLHASVDKRCKMIRKIAITLRVITSSVSFS